MSWTNRLSLLVALGLALGAAGCGGGAPSQGMLVPVAKTAEGTSRVKVLAATTRRRDTADAGLMFSGERADGLAFAAVTVSIPPDEARTIGEVKRPAAPPGDPAREFVTVSADFLQKQDLTAAITAAARQNGKSRVLVFVHGFNNRFDDAIYRFAQIVHDSKAQGIPVLFTWPSRGELALRSYTYDRESANFSRDGLEELLDLVAANPAVKEINVLAHSMGNWVTLEALRSMSIRPGRIGAKIRNVMLVAPDVDVDVFRAQIRRIGAPRPRILLFVSQDDQALSLSQTIWGGVPRLGEVDPAQEPYQSEFEREKIEVFDLTKLRGNAHNRAFEDITTVMMMIRDRIGDAEVGGPRGPRRAN
ncbi:MAG: alpha/beta hydrolase [Rhodoplanes sp.]|uniref:alpha/beta hydrolase n=1 Tax=Rhodoplanes sp. TaxID=1968906 RepID=UPI0017A58A39|nr:alpha/beta hydrolase [Rhodoplanes sp.]NVO17994.1 alpha/beta hydrolase [Rhodoplanes sp.]